MDLVRKHRFTVDDYHKMAQAGIFGEDDRVELVDGEVVEMTPIGARHVNCVNRLNRLLSRFAGDRYLVSVQNPLRLSDDGEPQPDLALLEEGEVVGGESEPPKPAEALLVVEVAETSLRYDREEKLPRYARAVIPEAWLVDLSSGAVEVYSGPGPEGYRDTSRFVNGEEVRSATLEGLAFLAAEVLP